MIISHKKLETKVIIIKTNESQISKILSNKASIKIAPYDSSLISIDNVFLMKRAAENRMEQAAQE